MWSFLAKQHNTSTVCKLIANPLIRGFPPLVSKKDTFAAKRDEKSQYNPLGCVFDSNLNQITLCAHNENKEWVTLTDVIN